MSLDSAEKQVVWGDNGEKEVTIGSPGDGVDGGEGGKEWNGEGGRD